MEEKRNTQWVLVGKSGVKRPLKNLGKDGMITFKWTLKKVGWGFWSELIWLRILASCGLL
jgi:hypothetical protein